MNNRQKVDTLKENKKSVRLFKGIITIEAELHSEVLIKSIKKLRPLIGKLLRTTVKEGELKLSNLRRIKIT